MAKTVAGVDQSLLPSSGRWTWKDETGSLEFISNTSNTDKSDKRRGQRQKAAVHFQDNASKRQERGVTPSLGSRALGLSKGRQSHVGGHRSPKPNKQGADRTHVALEDVKSVAIAMLSEVDVVSPNFEGIYGTEQFDRFLMHLLNFFNTYFEKRTHEQKPNPMNIEPSAAEKKYYADMCAKLSKAQQHLGQAYCVLVLGIGMENQHHMSCGSSRVSSTYKDRSMYETVYHFCTFVVWITFRRREYETVNKELSRILRSDTFNPAIRIKNAPEQDLTETEEAGDKKERKPEKKISQAEHRRLHGKRPAIKSIINQRSPALVSILPLPREESSWLFKGAGLSDMLQDQEVDDEIKNIPSDLSKFKVGIIGEPLSQFNPITLTPLGSENDEEDAEKEGMERRGSLINSSPHDMGMTRQATVVSQATTEALSDDE